MILRRQKWLVVLFIATLLIFLLYNLDWEDVFNKNIGPITTKRFCIISLDANSTQNYIFHLPITALSWRRIGFEPIVLIAHTNQSNVNELDRIVIKHLELIGVRVVHVQTFVAYEKITAMIIRLFGGLLPDNLVGEQDFIITSDTDLYPIRSSYYNHRLIDTNDQIIVWNAYCCGSFEHNKQKYTMYPLGHVGMKKYMWKKVMQLGIYEEVISGQLVLDEINYFFGENTTKQNHEIGKGDNTWFLDQKLISVNIQNYEKLSTSLSTKRLSYTGKRMDRSQTESTWRKLIGNLDSVTDVHSHQSERILDLWPLMQTLFEKMFDKNQTQFLDTYYDEFTRVYFRENVVD